MAGRRVEAPPCLPRPAASSFVSAWGIVRRAASQLKPMDPFVARMRRTVRRFSLVPPGTRLLVAVSGGADSMALLHALRELQDVDKMTVAGVAHLNHCLRGRAAEDDEAFCRAVAAELQVPFDVERLDVASLAAERQLSLEAAGHEARYAFFERSAERLAADRVAVGHTRDDQAETFLLRLLRGAGPRGLGGMHPMTGRVIRPLLDCSRGEVREFVLRRRIRYREDATNRDLTIPRNAVRHEVVPCLERLAPGVVGVLAREAEIARDDEQYLDRVADEVFGRVARRSGGSVHLDARVLGTLAPAIARRVVGRALSLGAGGRFVGFEDVERLRELAGQSRPAGRCQLPGQLAERSGYTVTVGPEAATINRSEPGTNSFRFSLSIPGEVLSPLGWVLSAERATLAADPTPDGGARRAALSAFPRTWAVLDSTAVRPPFSVRNWMAGDRFRPLGMRGTRKLQDLFVDRKTAPSERPRIPVVVDVEGRIVWVAGHGIAEDFRVTPATSDVVILKLKYWRNGQ